MARRSRRDEEPENEYLPDDENDVMEDEEEPRRGRRRRSSRDDEDAEEEERPRRRRPRDEDDEEEPRSRRRTRDEDDDEDDAPRARRSANTAGWGGYKKTRAKTSSFAQKWKPPLDDEVLVKFLDDEPFGSYGLHWFGELPKGVKKGWMCLESVDEDCPACAIGDRPKGKALFRIVAFDASGTPETQVLEAGTCLADQLENLASSKNGPLSRHYWSISSTGGKGKGPVNYSLSVIKEKDEEEWEDWGLEPLTEDELEEFAEKVYELEDVETVPKRKEFREVVDSLDD